MQLSERSLAFLREMRVPFWAPLRDAALPPDPPPAAAGAQPATLMGPSLAAPPPHPRQGAVAAPAPRSAPSLPEHAEAQASTMEVSEQAQRIARLDWDALRETVAQCRACGLCESRKQTVFGVGSRQAHWMIVGEAPGEQEDLRGEPFVGPAGRLLDAMLRSIGLTRAERAAEDAAVPLQPAQQAVIVNTLKCRPPRNRNPQPEELERCEPYLRRQIELVQPRMILAMGRFAVQSLLRTDEPIGRLRGRIHRYGRIPVVVTYHPAYLLRNLLDKSKAWQDLCLAVQALKSSSPPSPP